MKFYLKCLAIFLLVFAVILPLFIKGGDGRAVMSLQDWIPGGDRLVRWVKETFTDVRSQLTEGGENGPGNGESGGGGAADNGISSLENAPRSLSPDSGKMYKWQDENGRWHFSSEKPAQYDRVTLENLPDVKNVMEAPVDPDSDDSIMGFPGLGGAEKLLDGEVLDRIRQRAEERDH